MQDRSHTLQTLIHDLRGLYGLLYHSRPKGDYLVIAGQKVTRSQSELLFFVARHKTGTAVKDVANALNVTSGAITQLTDDLVARGLLERISHPQDRRAILLRVPDAIDVDCVDFESYYTRHVSPLFSQLDDGEITQLIYLLEKIKKPTDTEE